MPDIENKYSRGIVTSSSMKLLTATYTSSETDVVLLLGHFVAIICALHDEVVVGVDIVAPNLAILLIAC